MALIPEEKYLQPWFTSEERKALAAFCSNVYEQATTYTDNHTPTIYLDELADVDASSPSNGQVLAYNADLDQWEATTPASSSLRTYTDGIAPSSGTRSIVDNLGYTEAQAIVASTGTCTITDSDSTAIIASTSSKSTPDSSMSTGGVYYSAIIGGNNKSLIKHSSNVMLGFNTKSISEGMRVFGSNTAIDESGNYGCSYEKTHLGTSLFFVASNRPSSYAGTLVAVRHADGTGKAVMLHAKWVCYAESGRDDAVTVAVFDKQVYLSDGTTGTASDLDVTVSSDFTSNANGDYYGPLFTLVNHGDDNCCIQVTFTMIEHLAA